MQNSCSHTNKHKYTHTPERLTVNSNDPPGLWTAALPLQRKLPRPLVTVTYPAFAATCTPLAGSFPFLLRAQPMIRGDDGAGGGAQE